MEDSQTQLASLTKLTALPDGHKLNTYSSREQLNTAMTRLTESGIPAQALFVVGNNIRQVEVIAGKITYPKAALSGAVSGATFGAIIAVIMALVTNTSILANALTAVPLGIAFWMLSGVLSVWRMKNRDAFATRATLLADSYDLMVVPAFAHQARQVLGISGFGSPAFAPAHPQASSQQPMPPYHQAQRSASHIQTPPASQPPFEPGQYQQLQQTPNTHPVQEPTLFAPPTATDNTSKFGLRITDPAEYEATVRQAPATPETNPVVEAVRNEPPVQKYGKRIEDPEEYEATIRKPTEN